jgi:glycosyltransferase involved in cell wall biosynthesis
MKLLALTAGAGPMYCGSCLRDNALAAELIKRGHDVILMPLYTPTRTDEPNVSRERVFLGGISVYLEHKLKLFRHTPKFLDKLWDSPAVIRAMANRPVQTDPAMLGDLTVSMLRGEHGSQRKEVEKLCDWLATEPPPDLTILPNSLLIGLAEPIKRATGRPVGVTLQGEDLFIAGLGEPHRSDAIDLIRKQAHHADAFFAVSEQYSRFMMAYLALPASRTHVLPLGVNADDFQPRPGDGGERRAQGRRVGFFGRIAPEKGLHVLAAAYRRLRRRGGFDDVTLEAAGYLAPEHHKYLQGIEERMRVRGFASGFQYRGVLDRRAKADFLRNLDVFSLPATYDEPKGLSVLEAMACGIPVVQPRRGSFVEMLQKAGGGILFQASDQQDEADALADGLASVLTDPARAEALGRAGAAGVRRHFTVARMADRALEVYAEIAGGMNRRGASPERRRGATRSA